MNPTTTDVKNQMNGKTAATMTEQMKKAGNKLLESPVAEELVETFHGLQDRTVETYESSVELVRRNPVRSLAVAVGIGFLAGWILKRR